MYISSASLSSLVSYEGGYYEDVYTKTIVGDATFNAGSFIGYSSGDVNSDYSYRVLVTCSDGTFKVSPVRSMQIMRWNYKPSLFDGDELLKRWVDTPDGLDFSRGDFIESQIEMNKSIIKSGLLSIGNNIGEYNHAEDVFHLYTGSNALKYAIRSSAFYHEAPAQGTTDHRFAGPGDVDHTDPEVNIRFDATGFFVDGKAGKSSEGGYLQWSKNNDYYKKLVGYLTEQFSIEVGQKEGLVPSNSVCHYIRVIRER